MKVAKDNAITQWLNDVLIIKKWVDQIIIRINFQLKLSFYLKLVYTFF